MTSVQTHPHPLSERHPLAGQRHQLCHLAMMFLGKGFEQLDFIADQGQVERAWPVADRCQSDIARQRSAGQDDALISFFRGHGAKA